MTGTRAFGRSTRLHRLLALGILVPAAIGFSATRAQAAGETLALVQADPTAVTGHATNFTAGGTLNPDDTMFGFDIYVFVKNPDADPTCAADFDTESAAAMHSAGNESWVSPAGGFQVGTGPTFNQPFKITFPGHGDYLLCGYVQGDFSTFANAELRGVVTAGPATPPATTTPGGSTTPPAAAAPAAVRTPWITRKGHALTCHAGAWSNSPSSFSYRWRVKGHSRPVASGARLGVRHSLKGRMVACRVTATNAAGRRTASSRFVRAR